MKAIVHALKNTKLAILILCCFLVIGCGQKDSAIKSLENGSVVAWSAEDVSLVVSNDDCGKAFQTINGLISVFQYKDGIQIATHLWGGATQQDKKDKFPYMLDPVTGLSTASKITSTLIENGKLVQTVFREKDGATQKFKFADAQETKIQSFMKAGNL